MTDQTTENAAEGNAAMGENDALTQHFEEGRADGGLTFPTGELDDKGKEQARQAGWVPLADHEALQAELDNARSNLEAADKRADDAEAKLKAKPKKATSRAAEPKARKFKPIGDKDALDRDALRAGLAAAEHVEIALIDDKQREIPGSRPFEISGDVWKDHGADGLMLNEPVEILGPTDSASYSVAGYALLIDGKHVATQMRSDPFNVAPGSKHKIADDIIF